MRRVVLGDDHDPAGVFIQTVHDPRTDFAAHSAEAANVKQKGVDERLIRVARRRMDDEPGGFVDDRDVIVFVEDRQWKILRFDTSGDGSGEGDRDGLARFDPFRGFDRGAATDPDVSELHESGKIAARALREKSAESPVEAFTG
jgi:hypothetical protein